MYISKLLHHPWFIAFLVNLLVSLSFFLGFSSDLTINIFALLLSLVSSFLTFAFVGVIQLFAATRWGRAAFALVTGFCLSFLYAATFFIFTEFRRFIATDDLRFITDDFGSLIGYMKVYLTGVYGLLFLAIWALFSALWYRVRPKDIPIKSPLRRALLIVLLFPLILACVSDSTLKRAHYFHFVTADTAFFTSLRNVIVDSKLERLYTSASRVTLNPAPISKGINVLLIINESFAKYGLAAYGGGGGGCLTVLNEPPKRQR